ncbi:MAG: N-acetyl-gamma-glutamyl-phosphate reductase [Xanthomonadaceae bacterium]|nr:N-acetyl-gamma-glutamyl-phosphate reductase [Xanthomonadaceae bacterium]
MTERIGLVGARGYVGAELVGLLVGHPHFELAFVSSRQHAGQRVAEHVAGYHGALQYSSPDHRAVPHLGADAVVLALPNGMAGQYVAAFDAETDGTTVLVDLSADHRFDDAWYYGLPEHSRSLHSGQRRISNPGCYATAMQLAIAPMRDLLSGPVQCFGVSGYSGAGMQPSDRNDPDKLQDNLMPYALMGHVHEREVSRQLGHDVEFMPHVASHFRGLTITANMHLSRPIDVRDVTTRFRERYGNEPLVRIVDRAPWVSRIACRHHVEIGGFKLSEDGCRLVVVATLDNLLKGAATQALQNLNLAFGYDEFAGIPLVETTP